MTTMPLFRRALFLLLAAAAAAAARGAQAFSSYPTTLRRQQPQQQHQRQHQNQRHFGRTSSRALYRLVPPQSQPQGGIATRRTRTFTVVQMATINGLKNSRGNNNNNKSGSSSNNSNNNNNNNPLTNFFRSLPWNVQKEQARQARRLRIERNALYRQLGIVEDATYEEIVAATNQLIQAAGNDLKQKVKVEMAKDQILQMRLQERMASTSMLTKEARAQSNYERNQQSDDPAEEEARRKKAMNEAWSPPQWTQGLVVKPDEKHLRYQSKLWGGLTVLGLGLPPVIPYMGKFNWLICVAQLIYRGMPVEERERGGMGLNFGGGGGGGGKGKGHRKVAFALGFGIWVTGSLLLYAGMPSYVKGQRWEPLLMYSIQNLFFFLASCYLQPYKG